MTTRSLGDYLSKFAGAAAGKPILSAVASLYLEPIIAARQIADALPSYFDLDNAIGVQLDAVGDWIGRKRQIPVPVADPWFRFDDVLRGFDNSYWYQAAYSQLGYLSSLDDDTYRRLLRAKILANNWDGCLLTAEAILTTYFDDAATLIWIEDNPFAATQQNFFSLDSPNPACGFDAGLWYVPGSTVSDLANINEEMTVGIAGQWPAIVDLEILSQELLPVKPGGVSLDIEVTSINGSALFGFDVGNDYIAGLDNGAWGVSPATLVGNQLSV